MIVKFDGNKENSLNIIQVLFLNLAKFMKRM